MSFCIHCGAKMPDAAKFCPNCGEPAIETDKNVNKVSSPKKGSIRVIRQSDFNTGAFECTVVLDDGQQQRLADGCGISIETTAGKHDVTILSAGKKKYYSVVVPENGVETLTFSLNEMEAQIKALPNTKAPLAGNSIICPKCGGEVSFQTVSESTGLGCGSFIGVVLLALLACFLLSPFIGVIVFVIGAILVVKRSDDTVTYAVCQKCGHRFRKQ